MIAPNNPYDEKQRVMALKSYDLLDTDPEEDFDNITNLLSKICEAPISLISLLEGDRNYFKSNFGIDFCEAPRSTSFCGHAILHPNQLMIIEDANKDLRFINNPIVGEFNISFYAGMPLVNPEGHALGTLCVFDTKPRTLTELQKDAIYSLSKQIVNLFELRKKNLMLKEVQVDLEEKNKSLKNFASLVSHDLKSPLANITSVSRMLLEENKEHFSKQSLSYFDYIEESAESLREYINGILHFYKSDELMDPDSQDIDVKEFFEVFKEMLILNEKEFIYPKTGFIYGVNKSALTQILLNLIDNALKYNARDDRFVKIELSESRQSYIFSVTDNGIGIDEKIQEEIFELFKTTGIKDRHGREGSGIGLATVKTLVNKLGGDIYLESIIGEGSTFTFNIKK